MLDRLRKLVLVLMAVMVLLSPFMQMNSWDNFPVSTDDIELQLIFGLCLIGMFLVFVGVAKLLPELMLSISIVRTKAVDQVDPYSSQPQSGLFAFSPPLRT